MSSQSSQNDFHDEAVRLFKELEKTPREAATVRDRAMTIIVNLCKSRNLSYDEAVIEASRTMTTIGINSQIKELIKQSKSMINHMLEMGCDHDVVEVVGEAFQTLFSRHLENMSRQTKALRSAEAKLN